MYEMRIYLTCLMCEMGMYLICRMCGLGIYLISLMYEIGICMIYETCAWDMSDLFDVWNGDLIFPTYEEGTSLNCTVCELRIYDMSDYVNWGSISYIIDLSHVWHMGS